MYVQQFYFFCDIGILQQNFHLDCCCNLRRRNRGGVPAGGPWRASMGLCDS